MLVISITTIQNTLAIASAQADPPSTGCENDSILAFLEKVLVEPNPKHIATYSLAQIAPEYREQVEKLIVPVLGPRLFYTGKASFRTCVAGKACVAFAGSSGEKTLEVHWSAQASKPEIFSTTNARILVLPHNIKMAELEPEIESLVQQWTIGHSLHPFIYDSATKKELQALGADWLKLRNSQNEAINAGVKNFNSGHRSFLYVAPTGTGKTEVLTGILASEVAAARNKGKFHIMVAHQIELVEQFASDLKKFEAAGKLKIIRENNLELLLDESNGPPKVLVLTIQGLTKALEKLSPEKIKALRSKLGLLVFDEAHHLGAPTYLSSVRTLVEDNDSAKLLGATATPVHSEQGIQQLFNQTFEGESFWAYLDHAGASKGVERTAGAVVEQLDGAIKAGELTPLEHFYVLNPNSFGAKNESIFIRSDLNNIKSTFHINPERYGELTKRLAPLFDRHQSGFVAANSIEEAERLKIAFSQAMPNKKFVVFHGKLTNSEREAITNRMKAGEKLFLITVNLLDEGVNFPHMSLYIDLNRSLGVRQLLQRWGRVARLNPGKEGIEIATMTDWQDPEFIRDKLAFLEKFSKASQAFKGKTSAKNQLGQRLSLTEVLGLTPIDEGTKYQEFNVLLGQVRAMFENSIKKSPYDRVLESVLAGKGLHFIKNDQGAANWVKSVLAYDPNQWLKLWPEMHWQVREALIERWYADRGLFTPLKRIEKRLSVGQELATAQEDSQAYAWFLTTAVKNAEEWPTSLPEIVRQQLIKQQQILFSNQDLKALFEAEVLTQQTIPPDAKKNPQLYNWFVQQTQQPSKNWPAMHPRVKEILLAKVQSGEKFKLVPEPIMANSATVENVVAPPSSKPEPAPVSVAPVSAAPSSVKQPGKGGVIERLEVLAKAGKVLPKQNEDNGANIYIYKILEKPVEQWPPMSPELKKLLLAKQAEKAVKTTPLERLEVLAKAGKGLPKQTEDNGANIYIYKILEKPVEQWPPMSPELKKLLLAKQAEKAVKATPLERLEVLVKAGKGLPKAVDDNGAYQFVNAILSKPIDQWPPMSPELKKLLLAKKAEMAVKTTPLERLENLVKAGKGLPKAVDDSGAYQFFYALLSKPIDQWPPMSPELKKLLLEKKNAKSSPK